MSDLENKHEIELNKCRKYESFLIKILKEKGIKFYKENSEDLKEIKNKYLKEISDLILS